MKIIIAMALIATTKICMAGELVYKCTSEKGKITLSNKGCPENGTHENYIVEPNILESSGLRRLQAIGYGKDAGKVTPRKQQERYINPVECENAKRAYNFEAGYKYRNSEVQRIKSNEVYRNCGYWP